MDRWKQRFGLLIGSFLIASVIGLVVPPKDHFPERDLFKVSNPKNEQIANAGVWSMITGWRTQYLVGYEVQPDSQVPLYKGIAYYDTELRKRGFGPKYSITSDTAVWTKGSRQILVTVFSKPSSPQSPSRVEVYDTNTSFGERLSFLLFKRR
jgi:hypothetical protein